MFSAKINIDPLPAPRPRCACRGKFPSIYNPTEYTKWKKQAAELLAADAPSSPIVSAISLAVDFYVKKPKSTKLTAPKPDIDNYVKAFLDAMTDSGVWWNDDTQVVAIASAKYWAEEGHIVFSLHPFDP